MKIDRKISEVGGKHSYQYLCLISTFFYWYASDVFYMSMTFLEKNPNFLCLDGENNFTRECSKAEVCQSNLPHIFQPGYVDSWTSEFEFYCNDNLISLIGMIYFSGLTVGIIVFPYICDNLGRKTYVILIGTLLATVVTIIPFVTNIYLLYFLLPLIGFCQPIQEATLLLLTEKSSSGYRPIFSGIVISGDGLAGILIALLMSYFNSWRLNFYITAILLWINNIIYYFVFVESPHFLFVKNRNAELLETFNYIANFNNREYQDEIELVELESLLPDISSHKIEFRGYSSFFKYKSQTITIFVMAYLWFIESCMFSGTVIYNKNFQDIYLITMIGWLFDIITGLISGPLINVEFLGRKRTTLLFLFINVICCGLFHFCFANGYSENILIILNSSARFAYNLVYVIMFVYTSELFPTVIRSKAICICSTIKGLGGIFSSYLVEFHSYYVFLVFSIISAIAFLLVCNINETLGHPLPQEIPEIDEEKHKKREEE